MHRDKANFYFKNVCHANYLYIFENFIDIRIWSGTMSLSNGIRLKHIEKTTYLTFLAFSQREVLKGYVWIEIGNVYLNWIEQKM